MEKQYKFTAIKNIYRYGVRSKIRYWLFCIVICLISAMFLPWTQNIKGKGVVTTLYQNQRPQEINAVIGGKIIKWNIKEGDYVKKGDTLLQLAEVKEDYFDPQLINRTQGQVNAKQQKISSYNIKAGAYANQVPVLIQQRENKINTLAVKRSQVNSKINADRAELSATQVELNIATEQLSRAEKLFTDGLISKVDFERRTNTFQKASAVVIEKTNKLSISQNELNTIEIENNNATQEYSEKIFKAQAEQSGSLAEVANAGGEIEKLNIQIANYSIRKGNFFIIAPQDGQVIKVKNSGINEIIKDGEMLMEIVPDIRNFAVEFFIDPMDQVLIDTGQEVRFVFDGFPAIVFSGWPINSYGTFLGTVKTVETNSQATGKFRCLVVPKEGEKAWPNFLKLGTAASGFALLKDVKLGFEIWRNINGFPPEYYKTFDKNSSKK